MQFKKLFYNGFIISPIVLAVLIFFFTPRAKAAVVKIIPEVTTVISGGSLRLEAITIDEFSAIPLGGEYFWEMPSSSTIGSTIVPATDGSSATFFAGIIQDPVQEIVETIVVTDTLNNAAGQATIIVYPQNQGFSIVEVVPAFQAISSGDRLMLRATTLDEFGKPLGGEYLWEIFPPSPIGSTIIPATDGSSATFLAGIIQDPAQGAVETVLVTDTFNDAFGQATIGVYQQSEGLFTVYVLPRFARLPSGDILLLKATTLDDFGNSLSGEYLWEISPLSPIGSNIEPLGDFAFFFAGSLKDQTQEVAETIIATDIFNNAVGKTVVTVSPQTEQLSVQGEIVCPECTSGLIYIGVWQGQNPYGSYLLEGDVIDGPGSFIIQFQDIPENIPLWIHAFWDKDSSEGLLSHGDLLGSYDGNPLILHPGTGDIKITLTQEINLNIHGNVTASERGQGSILVQALDGPDILGSNPLGGAVIDGLGEFTFPVPQVPIASAVWVFAYWDQDGSGFANPTSGDLIGKFDGNPVLLQPSLEPITINVNIPVFGGNLPPNTPRNPFPPDGALDQPITCLLSWDSADPDPGDTISFEIYLGTAEGLIVPPFRQSESSLDPGPLEPYVTYFWRVVAVDNKDTKTSGPLWSFTTTGDGPAIVSAEVSPSIIFNESTTPFFITARVTHPLGLEAIASVTADLSQLTGLSEQYLYDDGSHGDETEGDGIYSLGGIVDTSASVRIKNFFIIAEDLDGNVDINACAIEVKNKIDYSVGPIGKGNHNFNNEIKNQTLLITYYLNTDNAISSFSDCDVNLSVENPAGEDQGELQFAAQTAILEIPQAQTGTWTYTVGTDCLTSKSYSISTSSTGTGIITGIISDSSTGKAITDALITSDNGGSSKSKDGYYLMVLPAGKANLRASADGYNSSLKSSLVVTSGSSSTVNFSLTPTTSLFSISGQITGALSQGIAVFLTGQTSLEVTTDENGQYAFENLNTGSYTVTPKINGYTFDPSSQDVTIETGSSSQVDFTAFISSATSAIQGTVADNRTNDALPDATIQCNPGGYATSTGSSGSYFLNLPAGSYTVTISKTGYKRDTENFSVTENEALSIDFALMPLRLSCPFVLLLGKENSDLDILRDFRDRRMNQTDRGKYYMTLFYRHAFEISEILISNPALQHEARDLVSSLMRQIKNQDIASKNNLLEQSEILLTEMQDKASQSLKKTITLIRAELKKGHIPLLNEH